MKQKIALVTGAHGTIGRYVALALASRDWRVVGLGHGKWDAEDQAAWGVSSWVEGDVSLRDLRALNVRPELIFHCAGSGAVGASITAPHTDFQRTVGTTAAVLEFLRVDTPGAALVYPSSAAVYGLVDYLPMQERLPLRPASPYGVHKKIAEELVVEHSRLFGLKAAVVRLFSIYGEGFRKQLLWDACRRILDKESVFFGTGDETRDWLYVADAAELLVRAADHASSNCPIVNGGFGEAVSVRDVVVELFRLMGRDDLPEFCGTQRPGDPLHYHADTTRAMAWGWQPKTAWRAGLARYVTWFKQEHGLA
ncbi:NAD(P)-dependent oxidoreductase [Burkholderia sp. L27(2015)]|uniref:NAD-dependent epimerase/dehydratase family protein n=1 Tax=Burkholderia sp. L27(2015) TaxID=1641858 RepID=UPI00131EBD9A|nr:NAD-dependent epimerase/dehydratase family protein [Burkholderia sp. L27(2015)]